MCCGVDSLDVSTVREFVGALLLRHTCQLVSNAHAITAVLRMSDEPSASSASTGPSSGEFSSRRACTRRSSDGASSAVDLSEQVRIATAIYPTASLMNHACDPSIISRSATLLDQSYIVSSSRATVNNFRYRTDIT